MLLCEDKFHDETWDKLAVKLRDEAFENGTLFTRKWEEEDIPELLEEAALERRASEQEAVAKRKQGEVKETARCLTEKSLLAEGLLPVEERGKQTPWAQEPGAEGDRVLRKSIKSRRGGKQSKLCRLIDFQSSLCERLCTCPHQTDEEDERDI